MNWAEIFIDATVAAIGPVAAAYALASIGLNLQFGYAGLLNFGHVGFMMVGAYGLAITVENGGSFWLGLPIGILAAVLFAVLLGVPTLRLRADYLAIVTISASEIARLIVRSQWADPLTNSVFGIQRFADSFFDLSPFDSSVRYGFGDFRFSGRQLWVMLVSWVIVLGVALLFRRLVSSPWGRTLRMIREDEDAARALGKNVFVYKMQALMVGGGIAGLAGMFLAIDQQNVSADAFLPRLTFFLYVMVILGGPGSVYGPVAGAVVFQFLFFFFDGFMIEAQAAGWFGDLIDATSAAQIKLVLVGVGLMLLMILRPQGFFGKRDEQLASDQ